MIETRYDRERDCGWRQPGGLYLVSNGVMARCGRLYLPLTVCHTCGCGIKPTRGWTWVKVPTFVVDAEPMSCDKATLWAMPVVSDEGRRVGRALMVRGSIL